MTELQLENIEKLKALEAKRTNVLTEIHTLNLDLKELRDSIYLDCFVNHIYDAIMESEKHEASVGLKDDKYCLNLLLS